MTKTKDPLIHFPYYCNEYRGMLARYSYEEKGAFMEVVSAYIAEDGFISNGSDQAKYRLFGAFTESERKALDLVFDDAIKLAKGIIEKQKKMREKRRESGKKGGRPKANQKDNQTVSKKKPNGFNLLKQNITYPELEPEPDNPEPELKKHAPDNTTEDVSTSTNGVPVFDEDLQDELKFSPSHHENERRCPQCGAMLINGDSVCPSCSTVVESYHHIGFKYP